MTTRKLVMVTGGFHSGKSEFAREYAEKHGGVGLYLATSPLSDSETMNRVADQQVQRQKRGWSTMEVETDLLGAYGKAEAEQTVMVDCLTYWINKIILEAVNQEVLPDEEGVARMAARFTDAAIERPGMTVVVTNELGLGIVPDNDLARRFRVLVGRVNQVVAARAEEVYMIVSGLPMRIK